MSKIAIDLISGYIEHWGQPDDYKMSALQKALDAAGINVVAYVDEKGYHCFRGSESEQRRATYFTICCGGTFSVRWEETVRRADALIARFKAGDKE